MNTLNDIIPTNIFSVEEFAQYKKNTLNAFNRTKNKNQNIFMLVTALTFLFPLFTIILADMSHIMSESAKQITALILGATIISCMITAAGLIISPAALYIANDKEYVKQVDQSMVPWQQKYTLAWNEIILPNTIDSLRKFKQLSEHLPQELINTPEYTKMYQLSESIKRHINDQPHISINSDLNTQPAYISLNNLINTYNNKHPF